MSRVKRGSIAIRHRKSFLRLNKGFVGAHSTLVRTAYQQNIRSLRYSYFDRRKRKKDFRSLWIKRINAFVRNKNFSYSHFITKLKLSQIMLNKKMLSQVCTNEPNTMLKLLNFI